MSDYEANHSRRARFCHVVLRVPDSHDEEDISRAMRCLFGHMRDGHGMRIADTREVAQVLLEEGGIERLLNELMAYEERYRDSEPEIVGVAVGDPFGLTNTSKDEVFH